MNVLVLSFNIVSLLRSEVISHGSWALLTSPRSPDIMQKDLFKSTAMLVRSWRQFSNYLMTVCNHMKRPLCWLTIKVMIIILFLISNNFRGKTFGPSHPTPFPLPFSASPNSAWNRGFIVYQLFNKLLQFFTFLATTGLFLIKRLWAVFRHWGYTQVNSLSEDCHMMLNPTY